LGGYSFSSGQCHVSWAAVHMLLAMLYCRDCSYTMAQKTSESETVEGSRSRRRRGRGGEDRLQGVLQLAQFFLHLLKLDGPCRGLKRGAARVAVVLTRVVRRRAPR